MVKLAQLLEKIKRTPLDLAYVRKKLPPRCRAVEYKSLKGRHRSQIFKDIDALVVLVPKVGSAMGHFICLLARGRHIEYFSSLGGTPASEMKKLGEPLSVIQNILGDHYITNSKRLQDGANYHINDCAVWVLLRCHLRALKLREFQELFVRSTTLSTPDDLAAVMGVLLLVDI